jgi:histidine triad (HIT) family protein
MPADCIFCQIAARRAQGHYIYQHNCCTAFLDVTPFDPGHTLVVPNKHFARLADLPPDVGAHLFKVGVRISQAIAESNLRSDGFNVFLSDGECAGQEVPHIHLHVLPRFEQMGCSSILAVSRIVQRRQNWQRPRLRSRSVCAMKHS